LWIWPSSTILNNYKTPECLLPEDGKESSFQKDFFYSYLEFWTMDKVHKPCEYDAHFTKPTTADATQRSIPKIYSIRKHT
jgi:hypothetical protein